MRFSLIDRIVELEPGVRITAVKSLTMAEEYLADHFPHFPVMPGVLMLESLTQAGRVAGAGERGFRPQHGGAQAGQQREVRAVRRARPDAAPSPPRLLKLGEGEAKLKAYGTVGGRIIVSARLTLACYNLADSQPATRGDRRGDAAGFAEAICVALSAAGRDIRNVHYQHT